MEGPSLLTFLPLLTQVVMASLTSTIFWIQNLVFIAVFMLVLLVAAYPILIALTLSPKSKPTFILLAPFLGFVNLLLLLLGWYTVTSLTTLPIGSLWPILVGLYCLEIIGLMGIAKIFYRVVHFRPELPASLRQTFILVSVILLSLFFLISARHYDPVEQTFFVPGYELNHDSINIVSSVRILSEGLTSQNNLAHYLGSLTLRHYPLGGTHLTLFFSQLLSVDPFFIYSRVILASFLTILYVVAFAFISLNLLPSRYPRLTLILLLVAVVVNYLTLSFLNTAVLGSTLIVPLILFGWVVLYLHLKRIVSEATFFFLLLMTVLAGVYLYVYVIHLFLILFAIAVYLAGVRFPKRSLYLLGLIVIFSLATPHNLERTAGTLIDQFISTNKETHLLKGMSGNIAYFINPFMTMSLWFSNPLYLIGGMRTGNSWVAAAAFIVFVTGLSFLKSGKASPHRGSLFVGFSLPIGVMLMITLGLTNSTYQTVKVMQLAAVIWPLLVYLILQPYLFDRSPIFTENLKGASRHTRHKFTHGSIAILLFMLLSSLFILSGLYASTYIGKPVLGSDLALAQLEPHLCRDPDLPVQLIVRDEWAKYFLLPCNRLDLYFDRGLDWDRIVTFNQANGLLFISQPCDPQSLTVLEPPPLSSGVTIVDECVNYVPPHSSLIDTLGPLRIYESASGSGKMTLTR